MLASHSRGEYLWTEPAISRDKMMPWCFCGLRCCFFPFANQEFLQAEDESSEAWLEMTPRHMEAILKSGRRFASSKPSSRKPSMNCLTAVCSNIALQQSLNGAVAEVVVLHEEVRLQVRLESRQCLLPQLGTAAKAGEANKPSTKGPHASLQPSRCHPCPSTRMPTKSTCRPRR